MAKPEIRWDAHSCVPLKRGYDVTNVIRHRDAGFSFVSINVGMDVTPLPEIIQMLASFRRRIDAHPDLILAGTTDQVRMAARDGKLAVAFDLEGANPILGNPDMVPLYRQLGVRQMHFAYNRANAAAGGCYDPDAGLTDLGARLVEACETAGIMVDVSHLNERSALEIMRIARRPVVFSHSNIRDLKADLRNITPEMIDACAACDGVIGVTGMSKLLPDGKANLNGIVEQIDHLVQRCGPRHVGIGLDYVYDQDQDELPAGVDPFHWFPVEHGYTSDFYKACSFVPPEELVDLEDRLSALGYRDTDIALIAGGNFLRAAEICWEPSD